MQASKLKAIVFILSFFVFTASSTAQINITGFTPETGNIGSMVTITGANFHLNPDSNIVFFGNVRAIVAGSSATSISVIVPAGAGHDLISIARSRYLTVSKKTFSVTYACDDTYANSFGPRADIAHHTQPTAIATGDLDGDGKPDVVIANKLTYDISVYRNNSAGTGNISYEPSVEFGTGEGSSSLTIADMNGDGKPDIVVTNSIGSSVIILRNVSSPGNISFLYAGYFTTGFGANPVSAAIADFNKDGKPDIAVACQTANRVRIFTQYLDPVQGEYNFYFYTTTDLSTGSAPGGIVAADFNDDNKIDIAVTNSGSNNISIFRNNTSGATPTFAAASLVTTATGPKAIYSRDLDGDGKTDLAVATTSSLSLLRNVSTTAIAFAPRVDLVVGGLSSGIVIQNFDGDGKPDIAVTNKTTNNIALFKNTGSAGILSFNQAVNFSTGSGAEAIASGDLDIDGKMDVLALNATAISFSTIRSTMLEATIASFTPSSATIGDTITLTGTNFTGVTFVDFNGTPAASFNIISDNSLEVVVGNGSTGNLTISGACGSNMAPGFIFSGTPAISDFVPSSGPVGTTVVVTGSNFNTNPSLNIVRFGSAVTTVTAATASSLTVKVPRGAVSLPVSVTTSQLTAYSPEPFLVASATCNMQVSNKSFDTTRYFNSGSGSWGMAAGDLDGDGRTDIAYGSYHDNQGGVGTEFTYHRNVSEVGDISLLPGVSLFSGIGPDDAVMRDFDGDGKLDVIIVNNDAGNPLSVFRNTSIPGTIQFAARQIVGDGLLGSKLSTGDIDKDGKIDLVVSFGFNGLYILKNISSLGNIKFAAPKKIIADEYGYYGFTAIGDLDGDGLADIVACSYVTNNLSVLKNISNSSSINFAAPITLSTGIHPMGVALTDIDRDGKLDIVNVHLQDTLVCIYRNTSTTSGLSFAARFDYSINPGSSYNVVADDVDGDTKPDLVLTTSNSVGFIRNLSTPGNLVLDTLIKNNAYSSTSVITADMDNDGKPDLIGMGRNSSSSGKISIIRSKMCEAIILCPNGSNSIIANIIGDTYQWQVDAGSGFSDVSNNSNYIGVDTRTLQLNNIPSSFYGYKFRCLVDGIPAFANVLKFENTWIGAMDNYWENPANWNCAALPDENTDVIITSGNVVLQTSTTIRSLTIVSGATVTVVAGYMLTINH